MSQTQAICHSEMYQKWPAFFKWFVLNFKDDLDGGQQYLGECAMKGGSDNIVWDLLLATGDAAYTSLTFYKTVELAIRVGESGEKK